MTVAVKMVVAASTMVVEVLIKVMMTMMTIALSSCFVVSRECC